MTTILAFLKRIPSAVYLYTLLAIGIVGAYQSFVYHQREVGRRDLLIAQAERTNAALRHEADSLAKAYKPQAVAAAKWKTKWDTLRAGIDTQWLKPDSVPVPVEVVRVIVASADSAVASCTLALQTCNQRVGVAQRGWDGARAEISLLKASYPSKLRPYVYGAIGVGLGYVASRWLK